jgi:hypothetical protein
MVDLIVTVSLASLIKCVKLYQDNIKNKEIMYRLDDVQNEMRTLGEKLDEQTIVRAKAGITHLIDGFNSEIDEVRALELQMARSIFSGLINIGPTGTTRGNTASYNNTYLICVGYYGNFHYFNYYRDYKNALSQVYKCVLKHPDEALLFFSSEFFSKNYKELITSAKKDFLLAMMELKRVNGESYNRALTYYWKEGLLVPGLFASLILYSFEPSLVRYLINAVEGRLPSFSEDLKVKRAALDLENLYSDLKIECKKVLDDLENVSLEELKLIA